MIISRSGLLTKYLPAQNGGAMAFVHVTVIWTSQRACLIAWQVKVLTASLNTKFDPSNMGQGRRREPALQSSSLTSTYKPRTHIHNLLYTHYTHDRHTDRCIDTRMHTYVHQW